MANDTHSFLRRCTWFMQTKILLTFFCSCVLYSWIKMNLQNLNDQTLSFNDSAIGSIMMEDCLAIFRTLTKPNWHFAFAGRGLSVGRRFFDFKELKAIYIHFISNIKAAQFFPIGMLKNQKWGYRLYKYKIQYITNVNPTCGIWLAFFFFFFWKERQLN